MKQIFALLLCVCFAQISLAQIINFADVSFKNALVNTNCVDTNNDGVFDSDADVNNDGEIQIVEAESIIRLDISVNSINSLDGIENFINLEKLICSNNLLVNLDVSFNTSLAELRCSNNQLTSLNLGVLQDLTILHCFANPLGELDFNQANNITELRCFLNDLDTLDVSMLEDLTFLICSDNNLTSLDLSHNLSLSTLWCRDNQLTELDFINNGLLFDLDCRRNDILELDFSENPNLGILTCQDNLLTQLDLSLNANLGALKCDNNLLESINIKNGSGGAIFISNLSFDDNPNIESICVDDFEAGDIQIFVDNYGYTATTVTTNCLLSNERFIESKIRFFPNPTKEKLSIYSSELLDKIVIMDSNGRLLSLIKLSDSNYSLDVSDLSKGIYFLEIQSGTTKQALKFVKN